MGDHIVAGLVTIGGAIIGIAIIAVLVSNRAATTDVVNAVTTGFANDITAAVAPVSGASASVNTGGGFSLQNFGNGIQLPH